MLCFQSLLPLLCTQVRIEASDGGVPPKKATSVLHIHVNRNQNAPEFATTDYRTTILETQPLGVPFTKVKASDDDSKVLP